MGMIEIRNTNNVEVKEDLLVNVELQEDVLYFTTPDGKAIGDAPVNEHRKYFTIRKQIKAVIREVYKEKVTLEFVRWADLVRKSGYSLLNSASKLKDIVSKTEYVGALTDSGVMFGIVDYYKQMTKLGKKPILGFECFTESINGEKYAYPLVLLAMNEKGYKNLIQLTSQSYQHHFEHPQVSYEMLRKYSEGVLAISSGADAEIQTLLKRSEVSEAEKVATTFTEIYGYDNFYLGMERHGYLGEDTLNQHLMALGNELEIKIVATVNSRFTGVDDSEAQEVLLCLNEGTTLDDQNRTMMAGDAYHIHTADEIEALFWDVPQAIDTTLEIAEKCNFDLELGKVYMPTFEVPVPFKDESAYFEYLCNRGFEERYTGTDKLFDKEYRERLQFEIDTINGMGFPGYFLIVWDFVDFARRNDILTGPGRGSACGSLVAYTLKITEVDPIEYGLLFERFLNPERISMPDIDLDFEDTRREEVIDYVKGRYGEDAVSRIVTFGTLSARSVVRDVARVMGKPYSLGDKIAKSIPAVPKMTLKKAFVESVEFKRLYDNESDVREIVDMAMKIEGLPKNLSQHACFDAETLVTTSKGLKRIVDVQLGDEVLTHNKRFKPVVDLIKTQTEAEYTLKTTSSFPIKVTGNHPMYVREMKQISVKNENGNSTRVRTWEEPVWKSVHDLTVGNDYIGIPINQESIIPQKEDLSLPFDNKDFWWVIGRYIGDGWTEYPNYEIDNSKWHNKRVIICCSKKTEKEKMDIIKKLDAIGFNYWIEEARTTYKIHLKESVELFDYLQEFGKYAHGKHLNADVFNLPKELIQSFLDGYLSADGSVNKKTGRYSLKTVSKELAIGLMQCINKAYHRAVTLLVLPEKDEMIEGRQVHSKEKYEMHFTKDVRKKERSFYEDGFIWTRLSSLEVEEVSKEMYNLTVLDDSSYTVNGLSAHNCGVIIAPSAVTQHIPQILIENEDTGVREATTQAVMSECEELGLLKMDFLGLRTMGVVSRALKDINKRRKQEGKEPLDFLSIPTDDIKVYDYISKGNTEGVFQLESGGMTSFMKELFQDVHEYLSIKDEAKLKTIGRQLYERTIAGISLYRPGPIDEIPHYIENMLNPEYITYDTPHLESILKNTYGIIVYQEQVMFIVRELAGFSKGQADTIRKAMGKKKTEILDEYEQYFVSGSVEKNIKGCIANGISETVAKTLWEKMKKFGLYAFNKSHAGGYAEISIRTAWLAFYYPVEYMTATLNSFITKSDKIKLYMSVCKKKGIEVLPPHVNNSSQLFTVEGNAVRFGLMGIKNMGKISKDVIAERNQRGAYKDFQDFAERMAVHYKVDKRMLEALIYSSSVDNFEGTRKAKITVLPQILDSASIEKKNHQLGQLDIFSISEEFAELKKVAIPELEEFDKKYKLEKEKEYAGFYVTEHPLDDYVEYFDREGVYEIGFLTPKDDDISSMEDSDEKQAISTYSYDGETVKIAGIVKDLKIFYTKKDQKPLYVFQVEDKTGDMKAVIFADRIEMNQDKLVEGKVVIVQGKIKQDDFGVQIMVQNMFDIEALVNSEKPKAVWVKLYDKSQFDDVIKVAKQYPGNLPVMLYYNNKAYKAKETMDVNFASFSQLQQLFGENVKVTYNK